MGSISELAGVKGCELVNSTTAYTPAGRHLGKKIFAIGINTDATVEHIKYTPKGADGRDLTQVTVTADTWIGTALTATAVTSFIPLGVDADEVKLSAAGSIFVYFK